MARLGKSRRSRGQTPRGRENRGRYAACAKRLRQVFDDLGGTYRSVSARTGVPPSTLHRMFEPHPEPGVAEGPTLMSLDRFTRESGVSADWILGRDVPKLVNDRSVLGGVLVAELERAVDQRVARELGDVNPEFVTHYRGTTGEEMLARLVTEVRNGVEPTLRAYRQLVQGRPPTLSDRLKLSAGVLGSGRDRQLMAVLDRLTDDASPGGNLTRSMFLAEHKASLARGPSPD